VSRAASRRSERHRRLVVGFDGPTLRAVDTGDDVPGGQRGCAL
jgi:hypothetical protein